MANNPEFPLLVRPVDEWVDVTENGDGDILLHDIFTPPGVPLQPLQTNEPPQAFRQHSSLRDGFDLLERARTALPNLQIATLYTNADRPEDLGLASEEDGISILSFLQESDLVLYGLRRSIMRQADDPKMAAASYQAEYLEALEENTSAPTLCYDYETTGPDATILTDALADVAQKTARRCKEEKQRGPLDERPEALAADLQYLNLKQWHDLGHIGTLIRETGAQRVTVVAPAEDSDSFRKLFFTGFPRDNAHFIFARPEITDTDNLRYDAEILAQGYIPAGMAPFPR